MKTNAKTAGTEISIVSRQMSPNSAFSEVTFPEFRSVADFVSAYSEKDKIIADLTAKFVVQAGEAKKAQDDVLPHLAFMQSLLSKKGSNHDFVIEAREKGNKIPWWSSDLREIQRQAVGIFAHDGTSHCCISKRPECRDHQSGKW